MLYANLPAIIVMVQCKYLLYIQYNYIRVSLCCVCALDNGCLCQHISFFAQYITEMKMKST